MASIRMFGGQSSSDEKSDAKLDEFFELSRLIHTLHKKSTDTGFTGDVEDVVRYCTPYYRDKLKIKLDSNDTTSFTDNEINEIIQRGIRDYNDYVTLHNIAAQEEQRPQNEAKQAGRRPGNSCCAIL